MPHLVSTPLVTTAIVKSKANGVEPYAWLREMFTRLPHHRNGEPLTQANSNRPVTSDELDYLLPDIWLKSHPNHSWETDEIRRTQREAKDV